MSTLILLVFIVVVLCLVARSENDKVPINKGIRRMVRDDLKAQRKRGDILTQRRRGNYR